MSQQERASRDIAASAERVYSLVSDLPRMGEWSNENTGGKWVGGASGPAPGAKYRGYNRNGVRRWATSVVVEEAIPGERFSFVVSLPMIELSKWQYEIEPTESGCRVTETWTDRSPGWWKPLGRLASGVADRPAHTRAGIEQTLDGIAAAAEAPDS